MGTAFPAHCPAVGPPRNRCALPLSPKHWPQAMTFHASGWSLLPLRWACNSGSYRQGDGVASVTQQRLSYKKSRTCSWPGHLLCFPRPASEAGMPGILHPVKCGSARRPRIPEHGHRVAGSRHKTGLHCPGLPSPPPLSPT